MTAYEPGDLVQVRSEIVPSAIVIPTGRRPECMPDNVPDLTVCCVPVALIRTPATEDGILRWVEISDLTPAPVDNNAARAERLRDLSRRHAAALLDCATIAAERLALMRELNAEGWSYSRLAEPCGMTRGRVWQLLKRPRRDAASEAAG